MSTFSVRALVLRHADYSDYDRMVTLFSPEHGILDAIARGCRRTKSPLTNAVEPFIVGEYQVFQRGERLALEQCQILEGHYPLRTDYERLAHGAYWLKLLEAVVVPNVPAEDLFLITLQALAHLTYSELPPELLTMAFEMHLMAQSGLSPCVTECMICHRPIDGDAGFSPRLGGAVCAHCHAEALPMSNAARRVIHKLPRTKYTAVPLLAEQPQWHEAAALFRAYLRWRVSVPEKNFPKISEFCV